MWMVSLVLHLWIFSGRVEVSQGKKTEQQVHLKRVYTIRVSGLKGCCQALAASYKYIMICYKFNMTVLTKCLFHSLHCG